MKIETQEQFDEFIGETIPSALFHVEPNDLDDESGSPLEEVILIKVLAEHPEALKFKPLSWFICKFLIQDKMVHPTALEEIKPITPITDDTEFTPRRGMFERYSLEEQAKSRGVSVEELGVEIDAHNKLKQQMIDERIKKGYTPEQALNETLRCLYIPGFSGPTFTN